jgi:hypothetical protein
MEAEGPATLLSNASLAIEHLSAVVSQAGNAAAWPRSAKVRKELLGSWASCLALFAGLIDDELAYDDDAWRRFLAEELGPRRAEYLKQKEAGLRRNLYCTSGALLDQGAPLGSTP